MKRVLVILIFCSASAFCQDKIVLKTFVKEEGFVQLRWAPTDAEIFKKGLLDGYIITRTGPDGEKKIEIGSVEDRQDELSKIADPEAKDILEYTIAVTKSNDEAMLKQSYGMLVLAASANKSVSKVIGVYYEDKGIPSGNYSYSVSLKKGEEKSKEVKINAKRLDKNPDCSELTGSSRIDLKEAYIEWEAAELNSNYGGYFVYKSEDNKTFNQYNETPLFHFTSEYEPDKTVINVVDTNVQEGKTYYYKVLPYNHFGDPGIESNIVEVYIQKRLTGYCVIDTVESSELNRKLTGFYEGAEDEEIAEFIFMRSDKIDGVYAELDRAAGIEKTFTFNHTTDKSSGDRHYFKVAAVSPDGDTAYSYPYYHFSLDQEPPGIPENLEGIVDSNGVAKITWTAPEDNDLLGYRVFRSNTLKEEFVEKTTELKLETTYYDTLDLHNLTSEVYYYVRAVDQNYNNGENTEAILLLKPDTIPPVPSAFKEFKVKETGVYLKWANSSSSDLAEQHLIREYQNRRDTVLSFLNETDTMLDMSGRLGLTYQYYLEASDRSGNVARSKSLNITYEIGYRPGPKIEKAEADLDEKQILLAWETIMEPIYSIQIYRAKNDGKFRLHKTLRENVSQFEDDELLINNEYHYKIKITYDSGISSKMSEVVTVMF